LVREKDKEPVAPEQDKTKEPGETQAANAVTIPVKNEQAEKSQAVTKENEKAQSPASDQKAGKKINKRTNSLFLSASAGPDVSAVGLQYFGKLKLVGGLGLGYTFRDRWTIRSGFYSASKVYTADKEEYKPDVPPANYPYLNAIDANCRVYEIPLSLSYNFGRSIKNSWFASTGLSSYIMKKEAYVYNYKYPNGSTYTYNKTLINENKHYFSVLDLSGGFQHQFSKTFSLTAEPYVKIPLAGVGFGNVKLNSAGVLFSLNMNLANFSSSK
jgi:hypothetical protein